jgi:hypothetical protein
LLLVVEGHVALMSITEPSGHVCVCCWSCCSCGWFELLLTFCCGHDGSLGLALQSTGGVVVVAFCLGVWFDWHVLLSVPWPHPGVIACEFEGVLGFDVVLFSVGPLLVMLFGVVLLADGGEGGVIVLFTGELVFELLKGGVLDGWGVVAVFCWGVGVGFEFDWHVLLSVPWPHPGVIACEFEGVLGGELSNVWFVWVWVGVNSFVGPDGLEPIMFAGAFGFAVPPL